MIRYLSHKEIDKAKWDKALGHSANKLIYASSWYLDIVSPDWCALIENDYESIMPLTGKKKYGIDYLYPPYFAQQLGIFSLNRPNKEKVQDFLNAIPVKYRFTEIHLNVHNTFDLEGFKTKKNTNIELDLNSSYEVLKKKFSEDTKRNIKKAAKHGIVLKKGIDPSDLIAIFRKHIGKKINNLSSGNYKTLLSLISACIKNGYGQVWGAYSNDKLCAGVVWLVKDGRGIFLFSATDAEAKRTGAMFFLIDTFIKENAGNKMILDFEGSNLPGLARFYKGFGSEEYVYLQVRKNNLPKLVRWIKG